MNISGTPGSLSVDGDEDKDSKANSKRRSSEQHRSDSRNDDSRRQSMPASPAGSNFAGGPNIQIAQSNALNSGQSGQSIGGGRPIGQLDVAGSTTMRGGHSTNLRPAVVAGTGISGQSMDAAAMQSRPSLGGGVSGVIANTGTVRVIHSTHETVTTPPESTTQEVRAGSVPAMDADKANFHQPKK